MAGSGRHADWCSGGLSPAYAPLDLAFRRPAGARLVRMSYAMHLAGVVVASILLEAGLSMEVQRQRVLVALAESDSTIALVERASQASVHQQRMWELAFEIVAVPLSAWFVLVIIRLLHELALSAFDRASSAQAGEPPCIS
jgi:hypothetical protein